MRPFILLSGIFFALITAQCIARTDVSESPEKGADVASTEAQGLDSARLTKELPRQVRLLKQFAQRNPAYNQKTAFLIDMRIPSQYFRFFAVDLQTGEVLDRALVAHGSGSETGLADSLMFSNTPNSYMTSLGTYKVGAAYQGSFGRSFRLHGLDPSNNKALVRAVVLHRYSCVPETEQLFPICNSLGCPMLSEGFFPVVEQYVDAHKKPTLLEIYY